MTSINVIEHPKHPSATARPRGLAVRRLCQDLVEPIQAAVTRAGHLLELAEEQQRPAPFIRDICQMYESGQKLLELVKGVVGDAAEMPAAGLAEFLRRRHQLRNGANQLSGFCQLLLLHEQSDGFGAFLGDFNKIYELCKEFDHKLLNLPSRGDADAGAGANEADSGAATSLPPADNPETASIASVAPSRARVAARHRANAGSVLVVDDSLMAREVLCRLLKPDGHQVAEAADGAQALEMMANGAFDLVLLDILMPGFDGMQVLQQWTAQPNMPQSSIIVVSGVEDTQNVIRCIELGAEDYLTKPIDHLLLQARVNSCLLKRQLHLRELEQFFPAAVARQLLYKPELLQEGRAADVTVLFCDIRHFSEISERLSPSTLIQWLSAVMEVLSECVLANGGVVVDYQGDEIMAMWGAPEEQPDHAQAACRVALDMLAKVQELNRTWQPIIGAATEVSIGINSGTVRVGNIGTKRKFKYGALGSVVNLGSRVRGATKYLKTHLLISGATQQRLDERFSVRRLATIKVANINTPVDLYELMSPDQPLLLEARRHYEHALQLFESRAFKEAAEVLGNRITQQGAQGPELWLMARTVECMIDPDKWKRVWDPPGK